MPAPLKQTPTKSTAQSLKAGVLGRIAQVSTKVDGIKLLTYGRAKTGKTRLFSTFPKPALLIGTEDGTRSVSNVKGLEFIRLRHSEEMTELTNEAAQSGRWKSICLDTAGGLQDMILKEILKLEDTPVQKSWGLADRQSWGIVGMQLKERLRGLLRLSEEQRMNVMVIAHERNFSDDGSHSELITPTVGAALTPSAVSWLNAECDYLTQAFLREETIIKKVKLGKDIKEVESKTGKVQFCLRLKENPVYIAGFRTATPERIPEYIIDPSFEQIAKLIKGE